MLCATSSLPIHTVTLAVFGNASTPLLQPCTDMTPPSTDRNPWRLCAIWVCVKFCFSVTSFSSQASLHGNTEFPGYNLDTAIKSSEQSYMLPPSTNSKKDIGGTSSEAVDQAPYVCPLRSEGPIHLTIELRSLVYHFQHIREQKQLKAKKEEAVYNLCGAAGAPAVSCLCPGSSKIVPAAEGEMSVEMRSVVCGADCRRFVEPM